MGSKKKAPKKVVKKKPLVSKPTSILDTLTYKDLIKFTPEVLIDASKLKEHPNNPNTHTEDQIERLAKIISHVGFRHPIIVSKNSGFIVSGHGRLQALQKLGWTLVPVEYQDFKDEAEEYQVLVSDNAIADWSTLDLAKINADFHDFGPDFDLELLGLKDFQLDPDNFEPGTEDDQQRLDQTKPFFVKCPECQHAFDAKEHELKD